MVSIYKNNMYYTKKEHKERNLQAWYDEREYRLDSLSSPGCETPGRALLDSRLISTTKTKKYSHKIIQCGDYFQVYNYHNKKIINDKYMELDFKKNEIINTNIDNLSINKFEDKLKTIEIKNILRSKLQMQRLIKSNETIFKSFITLTFGDNIGDIELANKTFKNFRDMLSRYMKSKNNDFFYVCVPEFQKRGALHYHLITNLDPQKHHDVIIRQKGKKNCYDVKYWSYGFSSVFEMKDINVVGYLTKYMTKDIDNRLWGKRRYFYSLNLKQPSTIYLDENDIDDNNKLLFIELFSDKKYEHIYCDKFGQAIEFLEYKKKGDDNLCMNVI